MSVALGALVGVKMIVSSSAQVPPRPMGASHRLDRRAAGHRDLLQFAAGEERQPLAVRGEERAGCAVGAGEGGGLQLIELADEEPRLARLLRDKRERRSVRRQNRRRAEVGRSDASAPMLASSVRGVGTGADRHGAHSTRAETSAAPKMAATVHGSARLRVGTRESVVGRPGPSIAAGDVNASSISSRASAAESRRRFRSFSRQRRNSFRSGAGVPAGSVVQSGSRVSTAASVSDTVSPVNTAPAGQHFHDHDPKSPDVAALDRRACPRLLRDSCRRPCRESSPPASSRAS